MTPNLPALLLRARRRPTAARRATPWAALVVAALVFKAFVPMLAAVAADLQGRSVADVCSVYGVRLAVAPASSDHGDAEHAHAHAHSHSSAHAHPQPHPDDRDHAEHTRDHCALSGLAACAVFAVALPGLPAPAAATVPTPAARAAAPAADASARWLALRLHAPPSQG